MDITVKCPCGSNYDFREEPVNGRLRFPVSCPNCGTDGTTLANEYIRRSESGELERERQQAKRGWGRFFRRAEEKAEDSADASPPKIRVGFGALGACVGAFLGMMVWYFIKRRVGIFFDFRVMAWFVGILAWGTGALAGLGARLAVPSGSFGLAGVASFAAAFAILGGQYLAARETVDHKLNQAVAVAYEGMRGYAQAADKAKNDAALSRVLNQYGFDPHDMAPGETAVLCQKRLLPFFNLIFHSVMVPGTMPSPNHAALQDEADFSAADLALFRQRELPELRAFLQGKPSQAEFSKALGGMVRDKISLNRMVTQSWSPSQFLWLVLGVISAYKIAYNRSDIEDL